MEKLTVSIPHQLGRAEAKRRIQQQLTELRPHFGPLAQLEERWNGDEFDFRLRMTGATAEGRAIVEDSRVLLEVTLPWFLSALAASIRQQIEDRGRILLGHRSATDAASTSGRPS